jgi:leader peptidase (prepilin peptidase)/N-methyltransferase
MGWIDLKLWILPNELVAAFGISAIAFHLAIDWDYGGWLFFAIGAVVGGGSLWIIRLVANKIYGMETLGFGDVKLMAAGGLLLGPEGILMAMSVGALCGVAHAVLIVLGQKIKTGQWVSMNRMALPAGPGFITGLIVVGIWMYKDILV